MLVFSNEKEMVKRLTQYYGNQLVYEEIGVGYGISDLIIIRNRTDFLNFINVRSGLYLNSLDEIKVLNFLRIRKKATFECIEAEHFISKSKLKYSILRNLVNIGAISETDKGYVCSNKIKLFAPKVYAIEAKLDDWNKGLAQAIRYQRFACKSYLALDEDYIHRVEINELVKHNIGLISVGKKVKEIFKPELRVPTDLIMNYKVAEEIIKNICV